MYCDKNVCKHPRLLNYILLVFLMNVMLLFLGCSSQSPENTNYVTIDKNIAAFTLAESGVAAPLLVSEADYPGVLRVIKHLQTDIASVTDVTPKLYIGDTPTEKQIVIVGTLGKSPIIDLLLQSGTLDCSHIQGKREVFTTCVVADPMPGIDQALVIVGSDKRGTIYGIYDLSESIGVSPWYWWADVPPKKKNAVYITGVPYTISEPKVRYRGIFINDENPALLGWANDKFGGFNAQMYEHMFELIMRLKGNFLWPAMWGKAFYDDDPMNPKLADEYGVVISTSHHEPMMRAHVEWERYGQGPWNYEQNEEKLKAFWREGIERMNDYESVVTLAMRGDGDMPMSEDANIELLQRIVRDQREILHDVTGKELETIPQVWALYKEVQEYYDKGMRVPDDITLLLCDDNWGNLRKVPQLDEEPRSGGYGIYYHFDYVGGPRSYKWINNNPIARIWEQMNLAWEYKADRIWVVNVGDLKPMEFPIEFFLDMAWDPDAIGAADLPAYTKDWAREQFGPDYAADIADFITEYGMYSGRRTPEMLDANTYNLHHYNEWCRVVKDYRVLEKHAKAIHDQLPAEYSDAYYQLVLHPIEASANLYDMYYQTALNHWYAEQGRAATNAQADSVKTLFERDAEITHYYNKVMANGKWDHFMDQTHIGYFSWFDPEFNIMPKVERISMPARADMGVAIQGSTAWWPKNQEKAVLPEMGPVQSDLYYIDIFNRGTDSFIYTAKASETWITLTADSGTINAQSRLYVGAKWDDVPFGKSEAVITITGPNEQKVDVILPVFKPDNDIKKVNAFVESHGYVSIEAEHYAKAVGQGKLNWLTIPDLGRTLSGVTISPVAVATVEPGGSSPHLEYDFYTFNSGNVKLNVYLSPTLNYHNDEGLKFAVSVDDKEPQVVNMHAEFPHHKWQQWVGESIAKFTTEHVLKNPGKHTIKFWMVDPGVVLQKLVLETTGASPSYLGPPESINPSRMAN